jgi:biopolymer transport protein ExbD
MALPGASSSQSCEINVTPLIDVLLVLLIIFMVIAPAPRLGLDSSIPQGQAATVSAPPMVVRLIAGGLDGSVRYQIGEQGRERDVAYEALPEQMRALFAVRQQRTVFVEADRDLSYERVAEVVGLARREGAGAVVLNGLDQR